MQNYQEPDEDCECYKYVCNCSRKDETNELFLENVQDIAKALSEIIKICGIHPCKANAAIDVINYAFMHYDEVRHRIDTVPRKRLCKEEVIHSLAHKCLMTRMEAQLCYSIMKRAFKAFFHGTNEGGLRNTILEAQLIHTQECMWVHAAKRTAQIFASYEGMFFTSQMHYENKIRCIYRCLYERLQERSDPVQLRKCRCKNCLHQSDESTTPSEDDGTVLPLHQSAILPKSCNILCNAKFAEQQKQHRESKSKQIKILPDLPHCKKCKCPSLICDCDVNRLTGAVSAECSQGPFKCQWFLVDDEAEIPHPDLLMQIPPPDHECPIDCDEVSAVCGSDCECDCDVCECEMEDDLLNDLYDMDEMEENGDGIEDMSYKYEGSELEIIYGDCRAPSSRESSTQLDTV